jgi:subtilase family serine protease
VRNRTVQSVLISVAALGVLSATAWAQDRDWRGIPTVPREGRGETRPHSWIRQPADPDAAKANTVQSPGGFHPSDIAGAYGIAANGGAGATIAVVDAYDSPNAAADLTSFSTQFGLPTTSTSQCPFSFSKVNEQGKASPLPKRNSGWEVEINLDVQWVHAIAPCAKIILVEAASSNSGDLLTGVLYAQTAASVVSMSWGGSEFTGQTFYDWVFSHPGVTFLASSGDTGGIVEWPSSSPNVIAVGATSLASNSSGGLEVPVVETAWNGSGGGCSTQEAALPFQKTFLPKTPVCKNRAVPDVAISGGPSSAVSVLVSDQGGWYEVYGTSLAVQLYAGIIGDANGKRGSAPLSSTLSDLYADAAGAPHSTPYISNFRDITSGTAGSFSSGLGWDFVTGLGSPLLNSLSGYLDSASLNH